MPPRLPFRPFARSNSGSTLLVFALAMPVLLGAVGAAVDYGTWVKQRSHLQAAADAAAMAAARELSVSTYEQTRMQTVADSWAKKAFVAEGAPLGLTVGVASQDNGTSVQVRLQHDRKQYLSGVLAVVPGHIAASSLATLRGQRKLCVIALDPTSSQTIYLKSNSWLTAKECDVHSNAISTSGVSSDGGIQVTAERVCSGGGFSGGGTFFGSKQTDCRKVEDPIADRVPPPIGGCTATNASIVDRGSAGSRHVLSPGTYCGGLFIGGNSNVTFSPGEYVIKDGPLVVDSNADVRGDGVGFYLTGTGSIFEFLSNARISLDAPRTGALAGLLFFEDRAAPLLREHSIKTNFASNMTGTIYLPRGRFVVDATNDVAQQSAFTVIVAQQLLLTANPKLTLNTKYGATTVPVPKGLGQTDGDIYLVR
ncbi:MAG TPA: TadE/TadG family type IV pilus assembly protein [Methylobacterium sp.]